MKSEPNTFSIDHLQALPKQTDQWEGVRNYQARNFMRKMALGDQAFFYHSSCEIPGIVGIMEIVETAYPDMTAFNPDSPYYDPKSTNENPRWYVVKVHFLKKFKTIIPLSKLKTQAPLQEMQLLKPGNRLSIMPVSTQEWQCILSLK